MARNYLAFDIEIAKQLPANTYDLLAHRPLGICCASTMACDGDRAVCWHGKTASGEIAPRMSKQEAAKLVQFLQNVTNQGYTVVTWNGLAFDFNVLSEESGETEACQRLSLSHVDMMFHVVCEKGHRLGLDAAAEGMGTAGKTAGVAADVVPTMWAKGRHREVMDYASQDAVATLEVARECDRRRRLEWISRSGRPQEVRLPHGWLTVTDAQRLPEPDTGWMDNPPRRSEFSNWHR